MSMDGDFVSFEAEKFICLVKYSHDSSIAMIGCFDRSLNGMESVKPDFLRKSFDAIKVVVMGNRVMVFKSFSFMRRSRSMIMSRFFCFAVSRPSRLKSSSFTSG